MDDAVDQDRWIGIVDGSIDDLLVTLSDTYRWICDTDGEYMDWGSIMMKIESIIMVTDWIDHVGIDCINDRGEDADGIDPWTMKI